MYLCVNGHLNCVHFLAIVNVAVMNLDVQILVETLLSILSVSTQECN
jgi:hypothetical protein